MASKIPNDPDIHITYQLQYRRCNRARCSTCQEGASHGPYWYAYWHEKEASGKKKLRSGYIGKTIPPKLANPHPRMLYGGVLIPTR